MPFTTHDIRQIHAEDLGVTDKDKYTYLMTYSFPCTDLSVAGKMAGMSKTEWEQGNSTRSGLLWEVERILKECTKEQLPDVLLMENVPQVHAEQNIADFEAWQSFLRSKGYVNHWKDLNAKDYGIPQNRDRCFMVSILSDEFVDFEWPKPIPLTTVMRDFLEESVDEKYYINSEKWGTQYHQQDRVYKGDIALAIPAQIPEGSYKYIVAMRGRNPDRPTDRTAGLPTEQRLEKAPEGMVNTLTTVQKDNLVMEEIEIKQATKEGSIKCKVGGCFDASFPDSTTPRGRVQNNGDVTPTIIAGACEEITYVETLP